MENKLKIGDVVELWYYGIIRVGTVVGLTRTKARVRFLNEQGKYKEAWRKIGSLYRREFNECGPYRSDEDGSPQDVE